MAQIKFSNGTIVNFNGNPTPQDIEFVANKLGIKPNQPPQEAEKSTLRKVGDFFTSSTQKFGETLGKAASVIDPTTKGLREGALQSGQAQADNYIKMAKTETNPDRKKKLLEAAQKVAEVDGIDIFTNPEYQKTAKQVFGEAAGTALETLQFGTFGNAAKVGSKVPTILKPILSPAKTVLKGAVEGAKTGAVYGVLSGTSKAMQENKSNLDILKSGATDGAIGGLAGGVIGGGTSAAVQLAKGTGKVLVKAGESIKASPKLKAATQFGSELGERFPRAINRAGEAVDNSAIRSAKIKQATPEVANAIKSNLDDRFINTIAEVDHATRKAFKQVVDIAEETPKTLALKKQPSIVSGELAAKQFDIIDKQKKTIGSAIGDRVKQLSKTETIDMNPAFTELDNTLASQGIQFNYTKQGVKLDFTKSNYSRAQRTKIQELYSLATEAGNNLSPSNVHGKDRLFSQLQREAAMDKIGKIVLATPEGDKNLFGVFRDVFSKNLDNISPEIKALNKKYRDLSLITEDIEDSILKTPNFNITKTADPAEFAKVNLRRIFGEAQSSPVFEAIADQMDTLARQLGYADASPKVVAEFAQELRKLYPESVPKAGFTGGITTGVKGALVSAAESVMKAGAPNLKDQRKALSELLQSYISKTAK